MGTFRVVWCVDGPRAAGPSAKPIARRGPGQAAAGTRAGCVAADGAVTMPASCGPQPVAFKGNPMADFKTQIVDLRAGTGAECKSGDTVTVHYTGTLEDGTK